MVDAIRVLVVADLRNGKSYRIPLSLENTGGLQVRVLPEPICRRQYSKTNNLNKNPERKGSNGLTAGNGDVLAVTVCTKDSQKTSVVTAIVLSMESLGEVIGH